MRKYKLALFDMDGTILDTLEDLTDATNVIMEQYGYPTHSIDGYDSFPKHLPAHSSLPDYVLTLPNP